MSVKQRDLFSLPDSIRQSPFMEGLRITPREAAMGPRTPAVPAGVPAPLPPVPALPPPGRGDQALPAVPRTYGPVIGKPAPASAAAPPAETAAPPTFGPMVVQLQDRDPT